MLLTNLFKNYRYNYRNLILPFTIIGIVILAIGVGYVGFKYEEEQSQLMADCLMAHRKWVVVSSTTTMQTRKVGNTYYTEPQTTETWGCVE